MPGFGAGQTLAIAGASHGRIVPPNLDTDDRTYSARIHGPEQWLVGAVKEPVGDRLLTPIEEDFVALVASGILGPVSSLPRTSARELAQRRAT